MRPSPLSSGWRNPIGFAALLLSASCVSDFRFSVPDEHPARPDAVQPAPLDPPDPYATAPSAPEAATRPPLRGGGEEMRR